MLESADQREAILLQPGAATVSGVDSLRLTYGVLANQDLPLVDAPK